MSALADAARFGVCITDILNLHRGDGRTWRDLYAKRSHGGSGAPGRFIWNRGAYIEVHYDGMRQPGERVKWSQIEAVIRAGTTIGDLAAGSIAYRAYCVDGGRYRPDTTDIMRAVELDVIARGVAALEAQDAPAQLDLFALEAVS